MPFTASFPALKRATFPFKKDARSKKKRTNEREGRGRVLYCSKNVSVTDGRCEESRLGERGATGALYLGSSITPLLRSVILGYLTFFWSSSF